MDQDAGRWRRESAGQSDSTKEGGHGRDDKVGRGLSRFGRRQKLGSCASGVGVPRRVSGGRDGV